MRGRRARAPALRVAQAQRHQTPLPMAKLLRSEPRPRMQRPLGGRAQREAQLPWKAELQAQPGVAQLPQGSGLPRVECWRQLPAVLQRWPKWALQGALAGRPAR